MAWLATWEEVIEEWKKIWEENPRSFPSPTKIDLQILRDLYRKGDVYHGEQSTEHSLAAMRTDSSSDMSWLYANYLACENNPTSTSPAWDVLAPLDHFHDTHIHKEKNEESDAEEEP